MEAHQATDLMREWVSIDVADALELLSPDFRNPEVCRCKSVKIGSVGVSDVMLGSHSEAGMPLAI